MTLLLTCESIDWRSHHDETRRDVDGCKSVGTLVLKILYGFIEKFMYITSFEILGTLQSVWETAQSKYLTDEG